MSYCDTQFKEIIYTLFETQNNCFSNKYEDEKIERFKSLSQERKLVFIGTGYYLKSMPKYLKMKFGVQLYGVYDWLEEIENKNGPFFKLSDEKYLDKKKYNKYKDKYNLISKEEFYKNPDDFIVFINIDTNIYTQHTLYNVGFKHIYTMRNLAKELISPAILEKQNKGFEEYDMNELNHSFSSIEIANIITLYNLLDDEKSKRVFMSILKFKLTEDYFYTISEKDDVSLQYFDKEVITLLENEVFIDCGGYTGDSIDAFIKTVNGKFDYIYSYEPDTNNFEILENHVNKSKYKEKIISINAGVSYKEKSLYLNGDGLITSCTENKTEKKAEVVTIEKSISHIPTFIKMDVQSFEVNALLGCMDMIKEHKPKLAISIYHKWDDLWSIPLLLKQWVPEYELKIRHYECTQEETILYAIPKKS